MGGKQQEEPLLSGIAVICRHVADASTAGLVNVQHALSKQTHDTIMLSQTLPSALSMSATVCPLSLPVYLLSVLSVCSGLGVGNWKGKQTLEKCYSLDPTYTFHTHFKVSFVLMENAIF